MKSKLSHAGDTFCLLAVLLLVSCSTMPAGQAPANIKVVQINGLVDHALALKAGDLSTRGVHQQQASFDSHEGAQSHTYQGVSLIDVLEECGIKAEAKQTGGLLGRYLLATGADGYQVVFSLGELSRDFGHMDAMVATRSDSDASSQGIFYSTAPGDAKGGRYVANLARVEVRAPTAAIDPSTVAQGSLQLSGALQKPITLDAAALSALPQHVERLGNVDYAGVDLWTLLTQAGLKPDQRLKNPMLSMFVVAQGRDGYRATFSAAELSPDFGNSKVLITLPDKPGSGATAAASEIRLVVAKDAMHGRWVHQLVSLSVESAPGRAGSPEK